MASILFLLACPPADPGRELNGDRFGTAPTEVDADTDDHTPGGDSDTGERDTEERARRTVSRR